MKKNIKITFIIIPVIVLVIGILLLGVGIYTYKTNSDFQKKGIKINATIENIDIKYYYDSDNNRKTSHYVYISFIADGKRYEGLLDNYNSSMYVGGKTTIYYDPKNPSNFKSAGNLTIAIVFMLIGGLVLIIEIIALIISKLKKTRKNKLKDYLMQNGIRVSANIDTIDYNYSYSINGRHPYIIKCSYKDPYTNKIYIFESKNIWFDIELIVNNGLASVVDVYIDKKDPTKYYMDIDSLKKYIAN